MRLKNSLKTNWGKELKRRLFALLSVFCIFVGGFSLSVSAYTDNENYFSINVPEQYTVINADNVKTNQDFLQKINYTASGFKDYLKNNNIVFYAINKTDGSEIVLKCVSSEFSKNINDLILLDNSSLNTVADKILNDKTYTAYEKNGTKFLMVDINAEDRGGSFYGTQFLTVKNGLMYSLSFTFKDSAISSESSEIINNVFEDFYISDNTGFSWKKFGNIIIAVVISLCIILFVIVAGYVVYTFINDVRAKNSTNDVAPYVKIKRRKF